MVRLLCELQVSLVSPSTGGGSASPSPEVVRAKARRSRGPPLEMVSVPKKGSITQLKSKAGAAFAEVYRIFQKIEVCTF